MTPQSVNFEDREFYYIIESNSVSCMHTIPGRLEGQGISP